MDVDVLKCSPKYLQIKICHLKVFLNMFHLFYGNIVIETDTLFFCHAIKSFIAVLAYLWITFLLNVLKCSKI